MSELEEIRRRRMEELQQGYAGQAMQQEEAQVRQQLQQIEAIIKARMTKEALQRYSNIKAADPDRAAQLSLLLAQFLQSGRLNTIDDEALKRILVMATPKRKETKITRK